MSFKISLVQMQIRSGQVEANLQHALEIIQAGLAAGSHLVLLPELWSSGYDLENARVHAQATPRIWRELDRLAAEHGCAIGGSLLAEKDGAIYNSFRWHSPAVGSSDAYQKIHLFRLMAEDRWLTGGDHLQSVETAWGKTGLAVCYDLRFPELFRRYALSGACAVALSAEWPLRRVLHWSTLLRARAIENQMFVFAANAVGLSGAETFGGSSAVITPWGETLVEGGQQEEELLTAEIDPAAVEQARAFLPILRDRHPLLDRLD